MPAERQADLRLCLVAHGYDAIVRSTDGGQTWSAPVKIMGTNDAADGPFPFAPGSGNPADTFDRPYPATNPTGAGDDFSWVIADNKYVHVGWGDSRNVSNAGGVQVFFSRIPLTTFKGQG